LDYRYSISDLLEKPQKYHMSPFEGLEFFDSYIVSRKTVLEIINHKNKELTQFEEIIKNFQNKALSFNFNQIQQSKISTEDLFIYLCYNLQNKSIKKEELKIIKIFVKKFEIKKRIFDFYNSDFKDNSENYSNLTNYILLSTICLLRFLDSKNLKYLNTFLKINDTICSQINKIKNQIDFSLLNFILNSEIEQISNLCTKKGLELKL